MGGAINLPRFLLPLLSDKKNMGGKKKQTEDMINNANDTDKEAPKISPGAPRPLPGPPGLARVGSGFSLSDKFGQVVAATLKTPKPPPGLAGKCEKDQVVLSQERQKGKHTLSGGLSSPEIQVS